MYDVIIVGGGPAGLSAALILGRSRRNVLVCDTGKPRNASAVEMHGYLSRDGINPLEFLKLSRKELSRYNVKIEDREIIKAKLSDNFYVVIDSKGKKISGKRLLLATGVVDRIPDIPGLQKMYGKSVHHCPYCDGWEVRDKKLAVYAKGKAAYMLSFSLKTWSPDVILCTDGRTNLRTIDKEKLNEADIKIIADKIERLEGKNGMLKKIIFKNGNTIERDALFFSQGQYQCSELGQQLGCRFTNDGFVKTDRRQSTGIAGLFVAGDAVKDMKFVIVAAAEGARAGVAINISLQEEEREKITANI